MSRISSGTMLLAMFALIMGLAGAYTVRQYLQPPGPAKAPAPPEAARPARLPRVPVASVNIAPGKTITMGDIAIMEMSNEERNKKFKGIDFMRDPRQIIGRVMKTPLEKGQPFQTTDLYPEGTGPTVSDLIKPGFRAATIEVTNTDAVAGFARPGAVVDVIFRTAARKEVPEVTKTLLEKVEVLAYGNSIVPGGAARGVTQKQQMFDKAMVTLAVTPAQAEALQVVEGKGDLSLVLRNPNDAEVQQVDNKKLMTLVDVVGYEVPKPPEKPAPPEPKVIQLPPKIIKEKVLVTPPPVPAPAPRKTMQIWRGGKPTTIYLDDNNQAVPATPQPNPVKPPPAKVPTVTNTDTASTNDAASEEAAEVASTDAG